MKIVINVDKIEKIYINDAKKSDVKYYDGHDEKRTLFGLIITRHKKSPHWHVRYNSDYQSRDTIVDEYNQYYINHDVEYKESIWLKPNTLIMSHSDNIRTYYNTTEERDAVIKELMAKSNKNLTIIKEH